MSHPSSSSPSPDQPSQGQPHGRPPGSFGPPPPAHPAGFGPPVPPPADGFGPPQAHQPVPGPATPPPGGSRGSRGRLAIIASAVLAIAVIVGGGVWYAADRGDDGAKDKTAARPSDDGAGPAYEKPREKVPANPKAYFKGSAPQPDVPKGGDYSTWQVKGSWLTDKIYAKASVDHITGLDAGTGKDVWKLPKPGMSCAGSPTMGKGNIAVVVVQATRQDENGARMPCTQVMAFDVDNGKKLWTKSVGVGYQKEKTAFNQATISGDTVAVGGLYGGAAFDLRTGRLLWKPKPGERCRDIGYSGDEDRLVAVRGCGELGAQRYQVEVLDPASGKPKWSYKLPEGVNTPSVVSNRPVVLALDSGEVSASGATDVFSLDERGRLRTKIALTDGRYMHECGTQSIIQDCRGITAGNGKLYVATARRDDKKFFSTNDIVAFSLATGKTTGERIEGGDNYPVFPIRMDGGNLLVYKSAPFTQVVSVDGRTKKQTVLLDAGARAGLLPLRSELLYTDGKLYLSNDLLAYSGSSGRKPVMVYGFAAK
ncbi:hypothetical protein GCM10010252_22490 [Streptomyces aureoverticillatus]|nr:hypothetical protein GCM10010252_22490 [Streptomyces aureoverticillatus]